MSEVQPMRAQRVVMRCCPGCGFLASHVEQLQVSCPCPRCGEYETDDFQIVDQEDGSDGYNRN